MVISHRIDVLGVIAHDTLDHDECYPLGLPGTLIFCEIELPTKFPDPQYQRYDLVLLNRHAHNIT